MPGMTLQAGSLFLAAREAAHRISASPRAGAQREALISIVFAVISVEAFFNEAAELANLMTSGVSREPEVVLTFAQFMSTAEKSRLSLEAKILMSNWIMTGKSMNRGEQPYQDFALLLKVRNELVHFRPNEIFPDSSLSTDAIDNSNNPVLEKLRSKQVLATGMQGIQSWTSWMETKAMAEWSCNSASNIVSDFSGKLPSEGRWGSSLRFSGRGFTHPVPLP